MLKSVEFIVYGHFREALVNYKYKLKQYLQIMHATFESCNTSEQNYLISAKFAKIAAIYMQRQQ